MYYTSVFIITRFQSTLLLFHNILVRVPIIIALLHKMAPFCMNTAKKTSGGGSLDPHSNKTLLDPIIHINTAKITIKTFQQLHTL